MSDMNALLDANLDDLADLPEFGVFPNGTHRVTVSFESKEVNKHPCIELNMVAIETVELANPSDTPLTAGTNGSVLYMLDNEFGQGKLKEVIKPFAAHLGVSSIRDVMEQSKGMEVTVVCKVRQNKDKTQSYTDVTKVLI
jgi:hypothetical protein